MHIALISRILCSPTVDWLGRVESHTGATEEFGAGERGDSGEAVERLQQQYQLWLADDNITPRKEDALSH